MKPREILTKEVLEKEISIGLTSYEIAKKFNIKTEKSVEYYCNKFNLVTNKSRKNRKEKPSKNTLLLEYKENSKKNICKKYGISLETFNKIIDFKPKKILKTKNKCLNCNSIVKKIEAIYCSVECKTYHKKRKILNNFNKISKETCYYGGFLFGDGSVTKSLIQIHLANNEDNLKLLNKLSELIYGKNYVLSYKKILCLHINDKETVKNLGMNFNIYENKTYNHALKIPEKYERDFVRGYFDADGWISVNKYKNKNDKFYNKITWGICSYLKENLEKIQKVLPVESYIYKLKHKELYEIRVTKIKDIIKIRNYLYYDDCICLERKKCKIFSI